MKLKLKSVEIHKYKCFENTQSFDVEDDVTVLVGLNESGKTSALEALAKTRYFTEDDSFVFNATHDYPRKEKKKMGRSGKDPEAIECRYILTEEIIQEIESELGEGILLFSEFGVITKYSNEKNISGVKVDSEKVANNLFPSVSEKIKNVKSRERLEEIINEEPDDESKAVLEEALKFFEKRFIWNDPFSEYVYETYLSPNIPKFLYYDEYYSLPSRINLNKLKDNSLEGEELKTAKALFELADIDIDELLDSKDFESFKAELESTSADISEDLFEFWSTNNNLEIRFDVDKIESNPSSSSNHYGNNSIVEHILDIRVWNGRAKVSLPLKNRSKGFNWFFSFLVWFKKIQEDNNSNYILLLDEPGMNLHAAAQKDLLNFIESLKEDYQIIYTTHSPFMVPPDKLHRVRTVLETKNGSVVSDSLQEKDPNTLFPLQAALGYNIAQNLYISKHNLLVEGISDMFYLEAMSDLLESEGRESLSKKITIVPAGGLEKVATFVSLLRGNDLNIICLLDSTLNQSNEKKLGRLITDKIIKDRKILSYKDFIKDAQEADVEDMFEIEDYLKLFNGAFPEAKINSSDLTSFSNLVTVKRINKVTDKRRFNHYAPAKFLLSQPLEQFSFTDVTKDHFESLFKEINTILISD